METERWSWKEGDIFFLFSGLCQVQIIKREARGRSLSVSKPEVAGSSARRNAYCGFWCAVKFMFNFWGTVDNSFLFSYDHKRKRGFRNNPTGPAFCIWGNQGQKREIVLQALRGRAEPPAPSCIYVLLPLSLNHFTCAVADSPGKVTSKGNAAFSQGRRELLARGGILCKVWETYWNYQGLEHCRPLHWAFTAS